MDPFSIALVSGAFISSAKDLIDAGRELTTFCSHVRNARETVQTLRSELNLLAQLLQQFDNVEVLCQTDGTLEDAIDNVRLKLTRLSKTFEKLQTKFSKGKVGAWITTALKHDDLKELLQDVERAKSSAMFAYQFYSTQMLQERLDTLALQNADSNALHSQTSIAMQRAMAFISTTTKHANLSSVEGLSDGLDTDTKTTDAVTQQSQHPTYASRLRRHRVLQRKYSASIRPWLTGRLWEIAVTNARGCWNISLRARRVILPDSPIVLAIQSGDQDEIRRLWQQGVARPSDEFQVLRSSLLSLISGAPDPFAMCKVMLQDESLRNDLRTIMNDLVGLANVFPYTRDLRTDTYGKIYRYVIETVDLDLQIDWNLDIVPPLLLGFDWLLCCPDTDGLRLIQDRQSKFAKDADLRHPNDLLVLRSIEVENCIRQGLLPFLMRYQVRVDFDSLRALSVDVRERLYSAVAYHYLLYHDHHHEICWPTFDPLHVLHDLIRTGVSPSVKYQSSTVLQEVLKDRTRFVILALDPKQRSTRTQLRRWLQALYAIGVDLQAYGAEEQMLMTTRRSHSKYTHRLGHHSLLFKHFSYGRHPDEWKFFYQVSWKTPVSIQKHMPGAWPYASKVPTTIWWAPSRQDTQQWDLIYWLRVTLYTAADPDVYNQLGYTVQPLCDRVQDDAGIVMRSARRANDTRSEVRCKRRSTSQPRSLRGMTWKSVACDEREWISSYHFCPFQTPRRLHYCTSETENQLAVCASGHEVVSELKYLEGMAWAA